MRTRVKICGITCREDALVAVRAGAEALGFVFAASPRRVTPEAAAEIITTLPPLVTPVGVFVDAALETVADTAQSAGLQAVQLHGAETPAYVEALRARCPARIIKAFRVKDADVLARMAAYRDGCAAFLLDAYVPGAAGGTGQTCDWELARQAKALGVPLFLAGGLTPGNVAAAIQRVQPYAVDASSGVEARPGRKDPERVCAFLRAIRRADAEGTDETG
ncbi:MAG: phosphoribosylanthranilate isomerase [Armatimonadetes bacterium]|jgi:phosphoribosylanthranilate isomerase|nr:phosphoribosylanthranilate isomerase [Armatimonadota bacterium]